MAAGIPTPQRLEGKDEIFAWFCTVEQQWYLNASMETSFDTIPQWLRHEIDRDSYYSRYRHIASRLVRPNRSAFFGGRTPFLTLHVRGGERGQGPEKLTGDLIGILARDFKRWVVISETRATRENMTSALRKAGCEGPRRIDFGRTR